jgi:hypothetical protein
VPFFAWRRGARQRTDLSASERGLDWFTFFLADIQTGFGPFVAVYLTAHAWAQFDIGLVLTAASSSLRNRASVTPSDCARAPSKASDERGSPPQKSGRRPPRVAAGAEQSPSPAVLTKREETARADFSSIPA